MLYVFNNKQSNISKFVENENELHYFKLICFIAPKLRLAAGL